MAWPTVWIFSASSSGMVMSNSSSNSITSSTVSRESAPRSLTKEVSRVTWSLETPICSLTISMTRSSTDTGEPPRLRALVRYTFRVVGIGKVAGRGRGRNGSIRRVLSDCRSGRQAAIDGDDLPGEVAGAGAGQVADQVRDILRRPEPAYGDALLDFGLDLLGEDIGHVGGDEAGGDHVDRDAAGGQLTRHGLAET